MFCFFNTIIYLTANDEKPEISTILLGGSSESEGDIMTMNSHLEFGPVCDATFGYNEVRPFLDYISCNFLAHYITCILQT